MKKTGEESGNNIKKRGIKNRYILPAVLGGVFLLVGFFAGQAATADPGHAPGSEEDPLVTASFVEEKVNELKEMLQEEQLKREQLEKQLEQVKAPGEDDSLEDPGTEDPEEAALPSYEIVRVSPGEILYTDQGTEVILRMGRAEAVAGEMGGMADLTAGENLDTGETVNRDHLILSSRGDGRGVQVIDDREAIFLVRGEYSKE